VRELPRGLVLELPDAAFGADLPLRLEGGRLAPAGGARLFHLADRYDRDETGDLCRTSLLAWVIRITWEAEREGSLLHLGPAREAEVVGRAGELDPEEAALAAAAADLAGGEYLVLRDACLFSPGDTPLRCRAVVIDRRRNQSPGRRPPAAGL
jgi:hypothetical protein